MRLACKGNKVPRILLLNSPSNPTGATHGGEALSSLAEVCREEGILVVSDEIYGLVHHEVEGADDPPVHDS